MKIGDAERQGLVTLGDGQPRQVICASCGDLTDCHTLDFDIPDVRDNERALCSRCYSQHVADLDARSAAIRRRETTARVAYKADAREHGVSYARTQVPVEFRKDRAFIEFVDRWDSWFQDQKPRRQKVYPG